MSGDPDRRSVEPTHPMYLDEAETRQELARVFDICSGCRRCTELCSVFPTLFDLVDRSGSIAADLLTPAEQDDVGVRCIQCSICALDCPYGTDRHEAGVDMPAVMLRAAAMRTANGHQPLRERIALGLLGSRLPVGRSRLAAVGIAPLLEATAVEPPQRRKRFSTWFRDRVSRRHRTDTTGPAVALVATCAVEYHRPRIGRAIVGVLEHHDIAVELADVACCGAPWLYSGAQRQFATIARDVIDRLAPVARSGVDIVVAQTTCAAVMKNVYRGVGEASTADLVADRVVDIVEYLAGLNRVGRLDTEFVDEVPDNVACHLDCRTRAGHLADQTVELLAVTGTQVEAMVGCSGIGVPSMIDHRDPVGRARLAGDLVNDLRRSGAPVTVGSCLRANVAVGTRLGDEPLHPVEFLARAYGLVDD